MAGTLIGAGINPLLRGMAPEARLWFWGGANDLSEMTGVAAATGAEALGDAALTLSNHSYGEYSGWHYLEDKNQWWYFGPVGTTEDPSFGRYGVKSQALDQLCRQAPWYLPFLSAGNQRNHEPPPGATVGFWNTGATKAYSSTTDPQPDGQKNGFDTLSSEKTSKNALCVGAANDAVVNGARSVGAASLADFSSCGPTDDGRIKPDLVANGVNLLSCGAVSDTAESGSSGTSMATPNACGSAVLLQQYHKKRFNSLMLASELKALLLHSADDLGRTGPDYQFGWGLMNTEAALDVIRSAADYPGSTPMKSSFLANGWRDTWSTVVNYTGNSGPLKVTLCWADPAADPLTAPALNDRTRMLLNDLDLAITNSAGQVLFRPWVLDMENPSALATTGDNVRDNVEQVLASPPAGNYIVRVSRKGSLIHPNGSGNQPFSVVITGHLPVPGVPPLLTLEGADFSTTTFSGNPGQPGHVRLKNTGGGVLGWTATSNQSWLVPSIVSGNIPAASESVVVLDLLTQSLTLGSYTGTVTFNSPGQLPQSRTVQLTVLPSVPAATALEINTGTLTSDGTGAAWLGQSFVSQLGDAARSGAVLTGQSSILKISDLPQGKLTVSRRFSGAADDVLEARLDNALVSSRAGSAGTGWDDLTFSITAAGTHEVSFHHRKTSTPPSPRDGAWLDNFIFHAAPVLPDPGILYAVQNKPFSYSIAASGNPVSYEVTGLSASGGLTCHFITGLISGTPTQRGTFPLTLTATNSYATGSRPVTLRVLSDPWVDTGADYPQTDTDPEDPKRWFTQTAISHDGVDAIQSGAITHFAETAAWMKVSGPGVLNFHWRVSSEPTYDKLILKLDGTDIDVISGEQAWVRKTVNLLAGDHELRFIYRKDGSGSVGADAAWVDEFSMVRKPEFASLEDAGGAVGRRFYYTLQTLHDPTALSVSPLPAGLTFNASTGVISGIPVQQGTTRATATISNSGGTTSAELVFEISNNLSLAEAMDTTGLVWETSGDGTWHGQSAVSHDGKDAARAPVLSDGQEAVMRFPTPVAGRVYFRYRTSSAPSDNLFLFGGSNQVSAKAGTSKPGFEEGSADVGFNGFFTVRYVKNSDGIKAGQDTAWVDQVRYYHIPSWSADVSGFTGIPFRVKIKSFAGPIDSFTAISLPPGLAADSANNIIGGTPVAAGFSSHEVQLQGPGGTRSGVANFLVSVSNPIPLASAVDWGPVLLNPVTAGGDLPWFGQTSEKSDGQHAGRSGFIGDGQSSWMQTSVPAGSLLQWQWKVSSEPEKDLLKLLVDGQEAAAISGEQAWASRSLQLGPGDHTIRFVYTKDGDNEAGTDAGWVDQLSYILPPAPNSPTTLSGTVGTPMPPRPPTGISLAGAVWSASGLPPGVSVNPASGILSGTPTSAGVFQAALSATHEAGTGSLGVRITIAQSTTPALATDGSGYAWSFERNEPAWFGQSLITHDGVDALQSGFLTHAFVSNDGIIPAQSTASINLTGPGILDFWCRVDSQAGSDFLTILVNGAPVLQLSGNIAWNRRQLEIQPGPNRVNFIYSKDTAGSTGADAAWLDEVAFTSGPVPPPVRIAGLRFSANGRDILIDFTSRAGRSYTVERSSNLGLWTSFGSPLNGNGGTMTFTHPNGRQGNPRWYYRVKESTP